MSAGAEEPSSAACVRFTIADPTSADANLCIERYCRELDLRFDAGFDPAVSISAEPGELVPPKGVFILAHLDRRPIGCGALKFGHAIAELKRMWIAEDFRGLGLGRRLLLELEDHARKAGIARLRLETNRHLVEAIALYRTAGFVEAQPFNAEAYAHHWFEKRLASS